MYCAPVLPFSSLQGCLYQPQELQPLQLLAEQSEQLPPPLPANIEKSFSVFRDLHFGHSGGVKSDIFRSSAITCPHSLHLNS
jgi:hypothetical protein